MRDMRMTDRGMMNGRIRTTATWVTDTMETGTDAANDRFFAAFATGHAVNSAVFRPVVRLAAEVLRQAGPTADSGTKNEAERLLCLVCLIQG